MRKKSLTLKLISVTLSGLLFATNSALADIPQANFWKQRHDAQIQLASLPSLPSVLNQNFQRPSSDLKTNSVPRSAIRDLKSLERWKAGGRLGNRKIRKAYTSLLKTLPNEFGSIRKILFPKTRKVKGIVFHIQDIHLNNEAQQNIGHVLKTLIQERQLDFVGLEGAFDTLDLSTFQKFPHQDIVEDVADYMLKENQIQGPVHTALTQGRFGAPFIGVDHPEFYQANKRAYVESVPSLENQKETLHSFVQSLNQNKQSTLNADLLEYDRQVSAYRNGDLPIGSYIKFLMDRSALLAEGNDTAVRQMDLFTEALDIETALNFDRVELERNNLLQQLVQKMTGPEVTALLDNSMAYRSGTINHADFYRYLKNLCADHGVLLSQLPSMRAYIQYLMLTEKIDTEALFTEIQGEEERVYTALIKTPGERRQIELSNQFSLIGKLLDFALTPEEWNQYKETVRGPQNLPVRQAGAELDLSSFEQFYENAELRDEAITANLIQAFQKNKSKVSALVTGGFHTPGINNRLISAGYVTINYVPKVSHVETKDGPGYLSVFTQEKTPLEKLFEGRDLFLAMEVFSRPQQATAVGGVVGASTIAHDQPFSFSVKRINADTVRVLFNDLVGVVVKYRNGVVEYIRPIVDLTAAVVRTIGSLVYSTFWWTRGVTALLLILVSSDVASAAAFNETTTRAGEFHYSIGVVTVLLVGVVAATFSKSQKKRTLTKRPGRFSQALAQQQASEDKFIPQIKLTAKLAERTRLTEWQTKNLAITRPADKPVQARLSNSGDGYLVNSLFTASELKNNGFISGKKGVSYVWLRAADQNMRFKFGDKIQSIPRGDYILLKIKVRREPRISKKRAVISLMGTMAHPAVVPEPVEQEFLPRITDENRNKYTLGENGKAELKGITRSVDTPVTVRRSQKDGGRYDVSKLYTYNELKNAKIISGRRETKYVWFQATDNNLRFQLDDSIQSIPLGHHILVKINVRISPKTKRPEMALTLMGTSQAEPVWDIPVVVENIPPDVDQIMAEELDLQPTESQPVKRPKLDKSKPGRFSKLAEQKKKTVKPKAKPFIPQVSEASKETAFQLGFPQLTGITRVTNKPVEARRVKNSNELRIDGLYTYDGLLKNGLLAEHLPVNYIWMKVSDGNLRFKLGKVVEKIPENQFILLKIRHTPGKKGMTITLMGKQSLSPFAAKEEDLAPVTFIGKISPQAIAMDNYEIAGFIPDDNKTPIIAYPTSNKGQYRVNDLMTMTQLKKSGYVPGEISAPELNPTAHIWLQAASDNFTFRTEKSVQQIQKGQFILIQVRGNNEASKEITLLGHSPTAPVGHGKVLLNFDEPVALAERKPFLKIRWPWAAALAGSLAGIVLFVDSAFGGIFSNSFAKSNELVQNVSGAEEPSVSIYIVSTLLVMTLIPTVVLMVVGRQGDSQTVQTEPARAPESTPSQPDNSKLIWQPVNVDVKIENDKASLTSFITRDLYHERGDLVTADQANLDPRKIIYGEPFLAQFSDSGSRFTISGVNLSAILPAGETGLTLELTFHADKNEPEISRVILGSGNQGPSLTAREFIARLKFVRKLYNKPAIPLEVLLNGESHRSYISRSINISDHQRRISNRNIIGNLLAGLQNTDEKFYNVVTANGKFDPRRQSVSPSGNQSGKRLGSTPGRFSTAARQAQAEQRQQEIRPSEGEEETSRSFEIPWKFVAIVTIIVITFVILNVYGSDLIKFITDAGSNVASQTDSSRWLPIAAVMLAIGIPLILIIGFFIRRDRAMQNALLKQQLQIEQLRSAIERGGEGEPLNLPPTLEEAIFNSTLWTKVIRPYKQAIGTAIILGLGYGGFHLYDQVLYWIAVVIALLALFTINRADKNFQEEPVTEEQPDNQAPDVVIPSETETTQQPEPVADRPANQPIQTDPAKKQTQDKPTIEIDAPIAKAYFTEIDEQPVYSAVLDDISNKKRVPNVKFKVTLPEVNKEGYIRLADPLSLGHLLEQEVITVGSHVILNIREHRIFQLIKENDETIGSRTLKASEKQKISIILKSVQADEGHMELHLVGIYTLNIRTNKETHVSAQKFFNLVNQKTGPPQTKDPDDSTPNPPQNPTADQTSTSAQSSETTEPDTSNDSESTANSVVLEDNVVDRSIFLFEFPIIAIVLALYDSFVAFVQTLISTVFNRTFSLIIRPVAIIIILFALTTPANQQELQTQASTVGPNTTTLTQSGTTENKWQVVDSLRRTTLSDTFASNIIQPAFSTLTSLVQNAPLIPSGPIQGAQDPNETIEQKVQRLLDEARGIGQDGQPFEVTPDMIDRYEKEVAKAIIGLKYYETQEKLFRDLAVVSERQKSTYQSLNDTGDEGIYAVGVYVPDVRELLAKGTEADIAEAKELLEQSWIVANQKKSADAEDSEPLKFKTRQELQDYINFRKNDVRFYLAYSDKPGETTIRDYINSLEINVAGTTIRAQVGADGEINDAFTLRILEDNNIAIETWIGKRSDRNNAGDTASFRLITGKAAKLADLDYATHLYRSKENQVRVFQALYDTDRKKQDILDPRALQNGPVVPPARVGGASDRNGTPGSRLVSEDPNNPVYHGNQKTAGMTMRGASGKNIDRLNDFAHPYLYSGLASAIASASEANVNEHRQLADNMVAQVIAHLHGVTHRPVDQMHNYQLAAEGLQQAHFRVQRLIEEVKRGEHTDMDFLADNIVEADLHNWLFILGYRLSYFNNHLRYSNAAPNERPYEALSAAVRYFEVLSDQVDRMMAAGADKPWIPSDAFYGDGPDREKDWVGAQGLIDNPDLKAVAEDKLERAHFLEQMKNLDNLTADQLNQLIEEMKEARMPLNSAVETAMRTGAMSQTMKDNLIGQIENTSNNLDNALRDLLTKVKAFEENWTRYEGIIVEKLGNNPEAADLLSVLNSIQKNAGSLNTLAEKQREVDQAIVRLLLHPDVKGDTKEAVALRDALMELTDWEGALVRHPLRSHSLGKSEIRSRLLIDVLTTTKKSRTPINLPELIVREIQKGLPGGANNDPDNAFQSWTTTGGAGSTSYNPRSLPVKREVSISDSLVPGFVQTRTQLEDVETPETEPQKRANFPRARNERPAIHGPLPLAGGSVVSENNNRRRSDQTSHIPLLPGAEAESPGRIPLKSAGGIELPVNLAEPSEPRGLLLRDKDFNPIVSLTEDQLDELLEQGWVVFVDSEDNEVSLSETYTLDNHGIVNRDVLLALLNNRTDAMDKDEKADFVSHWIENVMGIKELSKMEKDRIDRSSQDSLVALAKEKLSLVEGGRWTVYARAILGNAGPRHGDNKEDFLKRVDLDQLLRAIPIETLRERLKSKTGSLRKNELSPSYVDKLKTMDGAEVQAALEFVRGYLSDGQIRYMTRDRYPLISEQEFRDMAKNISKDQIIELVAPHLKELGISLAALERMAKSNIIDEAADKLKVLHQKLIAKQMVREVNLRLLVINPELLEDVEVENGKTTKTILEAGGFAVMPSRSAAEGRAAREAKNFSVGQTLQTLEHTLERDQDNDLLLVHSNGSVYEGFKLYSEENILQKMEEKPDLWRILVSYKDMEGRDHEKYLTVDDFRAPQFYRFYATAIDSGDYKIFHRESWRSQEWNEVVSFEKLRKMGHVLTFDSESGKRIPDVQTKAPSENNRFHVYYVFTGANPSVRVENPDDIYPDIQHTDDIEGSREYTLKRLFSGVDAAQYGADKAEMNFRVSLQDALLTMKTDFSFAIRRVDASNDASEFTWPAYLGSIPTPEAFDDYVRHNQNKKSYGKISLIKSDAVQFYIDEKGWIVYVTAQDQWGHTYKFKGPGDPNTQQPNAIRGNQSTFAVDGLNRIQEAYTLAQLIPEEDPDNPKATPRLIANFARVDTSGTVLPLIPPQNYSAEARANLNSNDLHFELFDENNLMTYIGSQDAAIIDLENPDRTVRFGHQFLQKAVARMLDQIKSKDDKKSVMDFLFINDMKRVLANEPVNWGTGEHVTTNMEIRATYPSISTPYWLRAEVDALSRIELKRRQQSLTRQEAFAVPKDDVSAEIGKLFAAIQLRNYHPLVIRDPSQYPLKVRLTVPGVDDRNRAYQDPSGLGLMLGTAGDMYEFTDQRDGKTLRLFFEDQALLRMYQQAYARHVLYPHLEGMIKFYGGARKVIQQRSQGLGTSNDMERVYGRSPTGSDRRLYLEHMTHYLVGNPNSDMERAIDFMNNSGVIEYEHKGPEGSRRVTVVPVQGIPGAQRDLIRNQVKLELAKAKRNFSNDTDKDGKPDGGYVRISIGNTNTGDLQAQSEIRMGRDGLMKGHLELARVLNGGKNLEYNSERGTYNDGPRVLYIPGENIFYEYDGSNLIAIHMMAYPETDTDRRIDLIEDQAKLIADQKKFIEEGGVRRFNKTTGEVTYSFDANDAKDVMTYIGSQSMGDQIEIKENDYQYDVIDPQGDKIQVTLSFGQKDGLRGLASVAIPDHKDSWNTLLAAQEKHKDDAKLTAELEEVTQTGGEGETRQDNLNNFVEAHNEGGVVVVERGTGKLIRIQSGEDVLDQELANVESKPFSEAEAIQQNGYVYDEDDEHRSLIFSGTDHADLLNQRKQIAANNLARLRAILAVLRKGELPPQWEKGVWVADPMPEYVDDGAASGFKFGPNSRAGFTQTNLVNGETKTVYQNTKGGTAEEKSEKTPAQNQGPGSAAKPATHISIVYDEKTQDVLSRELEAQVTIPAESRDERGTIQTYKTERIDKDGQLEGFRITAIPKPGRIVAGGKSVTTYERYQWGTLVNNTDGTTSVQFGAVEGGKPLYDVRPTQMENDEGMTTFHYTETGHLDRVETRAQTDQEQASSTTRHQRNEDHQPTVDANNNFTLETDVAQDSKRIRRVITPNGQVLKVVDGFNTTVNTPGQFKRNVETGAWEALETLKIESGQHIEYVTLEVLDNGNTESTRYFVTEEYEFDGTRKITVQLYAVELKTADGYLIQRKRAHTWVDYDEYKTHTDFIIDHFDVARSRSLPKEYPGYNFRDLAILERTELETADGKKTELFKYDFNIGFVTVSENGTDKKVLEMSVATRYANKDVIPDKKIITDIPEDILLKKGFKTTWHWIPMTVKDADGQDVVDARFRLVRNVYHPSQDVLEYKYDVDNAYGLPTRVLVHPDDFKDLPYPHRVGFLMKSRGKTFKTTTNGHEVFVWGQPYVDEDGKVLIDETPELVSDGPFKGLALFSEHTRQDPKVEGERPGFNVPKTNRFMNLLGQIIVEKPTDVPENDSYNTNVYRGFIPNPFNFTMDPLHVRMDLSGSKTQKDINYTPPGFVGDDLNQRRIQRPNPNQQNNNNRPPFHLLAGAAVSLISIVGSIYSLSLSIELIFGFQIISVVALLFSPVLIWMSLRFTLVTVVGAVALAAGVTGRNPTALERSTFVMRWSSADHPIELNADLGLAPSRADRDSGKILVHPMFAAHWGVFEPAKNAALRLLISHEKVHLGRAQLIIPGLSPLVQGGVEILNEIPAYLRILLPSGVKSAGPTAEEKKQIELATLVAETMALIQNNSNDPEIANNINTIIGGTTPLNQNLIQFDQAITSTNLYYRRALAVSIQNAFDGLIPEERDLRFLLQDLLNRIGATQSVPMIEMIETSIQSKQFNSVVITRSLLDELNNEGLKTLLTQLSQSRAPLIVIREDADFVQEVRTLATSVGYAGPLDVRNRNEIFGPYGQLQAHLVENLLPQQRLLESDAINVVVAKNTVIDTQQLKAESLLRAGSFIGAELVANIIRAVPLKTMDLESLDDLIKYLGKFA